MSLQDKQDALSNDQSRPTDHLLAKFESSEFDAIAYLNETLPVLNISSQQPSIKNGRATQLQSAAADLQNFLTKINTYNIRTSSDLNTLTDEILRSGSRLAYEVEVLRSDANTISETLTEHLKDDVNLFTHSARTIDKTDIDGEGSQSQEVPAGQVRQGPGRDPDFLAKLRLYGQVKGRLESVVGVFGQALEWPLPPSEPSLISISAPELGMATTAEDDKAQDILRKFRAEITDLLDSEGGGLAGLNTANQRLVELEQLAAVWKGTSEERTRMRFVESLGKLVEDRRKISNMKMPSMQQIQADDSSMGSSSMPGRIASGAASGLFRNLQRLKDEMYLE